jgi:hypothetical protein
VEGVGARVTTPIVGGEGGGLTFHYIGCMAWSTSQVSTMDKYKYTSLYISLTLLLPHLVAGTLFYSLVVG